MDSTFITIYIIVLVVAAIGLISFCIQFSRLNYIERVVNGLRNRSNRPGDVVKRGWMLRQATWTSQQTQFGTSKREIKSTLKERISESKESGLFDDYDCEVLLKIIEA